MKKKHVLATIDGSIFVSSTFLATLGNYVNVASNPIQIVNHLAPYAIEMERKLSCHNLLYQKRVE